MPVYVIDYEWTDGKDRMLYGHAYYSSACAFEALDRFRKDTSLPGLDIREVRRQMPEKECRP